MKQIPVNRQRLSDSPSSHTARPVSGAFGRVDFRKTILITPTLPYPLPRHKRGIWPSYDIAPLSAESTGATVIRSGRGAEAIWSCLSTLFDAMGPAARTRQYIFFGEAYSLMADGRSTTSITPAVYMMADPYAFAKGRLSILYRHPYAGSIAREPVAGTLITAPGDPTSVDSAAVCKIDPNTMIDSSAFWFTAFMNDRRILDYSVKIVPVQQVKVSSETAPTTALSVAHVFKQELERARVHAEDADSSVEN